MGYMKEYLLAQREYDTREPPDYWLEYEASDAEEDWWNEYQAEQEADRTIPTGGRSE